MTRWAIILTLTLLIGGCATARRTPPAGDPPPHAAAPQYGQQTVVANALIFDPPLIGGEPAVQLPRAARQPSAFVGFDELTTTHFYIRVNDRHTADWTERYERRAIIEQTGTRHR